jgi:hypothetical protein
MPGTPIIELRHRVKDRSLSPDGGFIQRRSRIDSRSADR